MQRHPAQHQPPRRFEGRPLARPDEELVDQGLGFDLGTLLSRRRILAMIGAGTATIAMAPRLAAASTPPSTPADLVEIPTETAGPYPGDGSNGPDVLEQSGIVRSDIRSSFGAYSGTAEGVPITLELTIVDLANGGVPFTGVAVYVWHCTREGGYSLYSEGIVEENFLRGVQIADADGRMTFTSIFPACYPGRWPHVHFEVYPDEASITESTSAIATSQLAFPADVCDEVYVNAEGYAASVATLAQVSLETDGIFADDGGVSQLATVTGDLDNGYTVSLTVGVDVTTEEPVGGMGGGPGGPGGPGTDGGPGGPGGGMPPGGGPGGPGGPTGPGMPGDGDAPDGSTPD